MQQNNDINRFQNKQLALPVHLLNKLNPQVKSSFLVPKVSRQQLPARRQSNAAGCSTVINNDVSIVPSSNKSEMRYQPRDPVSMGNDVESVVKSNISARMLQLTSSSPAATVPPSVTEIASLETSPYHSNKENQHDSLHDGDGHGGGSKSNIQPIQLTKKPLKRLSGERVVGKSKKSNQPASVSQRKSIRKKTQQKYSLSSDSDFESMVKSRKSGQSSVQNSSVKSKSKSRKSSDYIKSLIKTVSSSLNNQTPRKRTINSDPNDDYFDAHPEEQTIVIKAVDSKPVCPQWSVAETKLLMDLVFRHRQQLKQEDFWDLISADMGSRSAEECLIKYQALFDDSPQAKRLSGGKRNSLLKLVHGSDSDDDRPQNINGIDKEKDQSPTGNMPKEPQVFQPMEITARKGTLARKRQLRQLIEQRKVLQQLPDNDYFADGKDGNTMDAAALQTPARQCYLKTSFTPLSAKFGDNDNDASPGILRSFDPQEIDAYVHNLRNAKKKQGANGRVIDDDTTQVSLNASIRRELKQVSYKGDKIVQKFVNEVLNGRKTVFVNQFDHQGDDEERSDSENIDHNLQQNHDGNSQTLDSLQYYE
ncbi:hypothetical protein MIR68_007794 [Amoeboaphelidium protococcarum]|nr:hypothetical protein MIR68_007794 [Amoeboaphelidium protococcarum]